MEADSAESDSGEVGGPDDSSSMATLMLKSGVELAARGHCPKRKGIIATISRQREESVGYLSEKTGLKVMMCVPDPSPFVPEKHYNKSQNLLLSYTTTSKTRR